MQTMYLCTSVLSQNNSAVKIDTDNDGEFARHINRESLQKKMAKLIWIHAIFFHSCYMKHQPITINYKISYKGSKTLLV